MSESIPMATDPSAALAKSAAQREMALWITDILTQDARDLERIGSRVLFLQFVLKRFYSDDGDAPKSKDLADRLKVSESRVSIALSKMSEALEAKLKS